MSTATASILLILTVLPGVCIASWLILRLVGRLVAHEPYLPFVPSGRQFRRAIISTASKLSAPPRVVYELGSGNGTLLPLLHRLWPQATIIGVEHSRLLYTWSWLRTLQYRSHIKLWRKDFFTVDVHDADLIIGFWIHDFMPALTAQFIKQCQPGCIIISNTFKLTTHPRLQLINQYPGRFGTTWVYQVLRSPHANPAS